MKKIIEDISVILSDTEQESETFTSHININILET